jgi:hypothetical protein
VYKPCRDSGQGQQIGVTAELRVRARGARCGLTPLLNDDGVRRLAIAVLQQAVADLQSAIPEYRRSAAAFMAWREDFDGFCARWLDRR